MGVRPFLGVLGLTLPVGFGPSFSWVGVGLFSRGDCWPFSGLKLGLVLRSLGSGVGQLCVLSLGFFFVKKTMLISEGGGKEEPLVATGWPFSWVGVGPSVGVGPLGWGWGCPALCGKNLNLLQSYDDFLSGSGGKVDRGYALELGSALGLGSALPSRGWPFAPFGPGQPEKERTGKARPQPKGRGRELDPIQKGLRGKPGPTQKGKDGESLKILVTKKT